MVSKKVQPGQNFLCYFCYQLDQLGLASYYRFQLSSTQFCEWKNIVEQVCKSVTVMITPFFANVKQNLVLRISDKFTSLLRLLKYLKTIELYTRVEKFE